ncbi:MAG: hypothetical protein WBW33_36100 [Bryobacteraceae bacterium]
MLKIAKLACLATLCPLLIWAQAASPAHVQVQVMVTVGHHNGHEAPELTRNELIVMQGDNPAPIANLFPLRGDRAGVELFVLVDNCSNCEPGPIFDELRHFLISQPSTTLVGVAYIDSGHLRVLENPTQDHERAVKALSAPAGSKPSSPFIALNELIETWTQGSSQRAVLMISNGIDPSTPPEMLQADRSVEGALRAAQRGSVTVYAIYHPSADYSSTDTSKVYSGQVQLSHLALETGGEAYFLGFGPMPSVAPFLADLSDHLANRYLLEFIGHTGSSTLQRITVKSTNPDVELMVPDRVPVTARPPLPVSGKD